MSSEFTRDHLKHFVPFDTLPDAHLDQILEKSRLLSLPAGKIVFKRGDSARQCFYLLAGSVDLSDFQFNLTRIRAGDDEARQALDNSEPHAHSAITKEPSAFLVVDRDHLDLVVTWDQAGEYLVTEIASEDTTNDWMQSLLSNKLFMQIPTANIQQLFVKFAKRVVKKHETILRQGEDGDLFYVIASGNASITRHTAWGDVSVGTLQAGQYFGEEALVGDTVRNATVTMNDDGILMSLGKDDFKRLLQDPLIERLPVSALDDLRKKTHVRLIDVRLRWEYNHSHIEGAESVPLKDLRKKLEELPRDPTYVITCDGGRRSELGAYLFREAGCKALVLRPHG